MKHNEQTVIDENKYYTIASGTGKVLEVENGSTENGAAIRMWKNQNEPWQQWQFIEEGERVYRIQNRFTGKVLDLVEGVHGSSQIWIVEPTNDGRVKVRSNLSGKCMDIVGMSRENGARLQIWQDVNGDNQLWTITQAKEKKAKKPEAEPVKETVAPAQPEAEPVKETVASAQPEAEPVTEAVAAAQPEADTVKAPETEAPKAAEAPAKPEAAKRTAKSRKASRKSKKSKK